MNNKSSFLNINRRILFTFVTILAAVISACASESGTLLVDDEESGTELSLDQNYDQVRNGARLVLSYDLQSNSFKGFVENTTDATLKQVRVEVHLSNGVELGPTTPVDLDPGESIDVSLSAANENIAGWSAHPEVGESGGGEHGNGEGCNEHGDEGESEHSEDNSD